MARILLVLLASCHAVFAGAQESEPADDQPSTLSEVVADKKKVEVVVEPWSDRVDRLIAEISRFEKTADDADELYVALDRVLQDRLHAINARMEHASSPKERLNLDAELPAAIVTISDLHKNVGELYAARLRLLNNLTSRMRLEVVATDVIGVGQLKMEFEYIWEQVRFRALNLPAASENLWRRIKIAPLPMIWHFIQLLLVIAIFRWWRKWLPDTLSRMQASLAEIRPRAPAVMRRIRLIWYIEQLRRPVEWMLLAAVIFSMISLEGLNLLANIAESIVKWILMGWLSVSILDAFTARGAAGLAGVDAAIRLKSLRLVAVWLVMLGLGLDLAINLTGVATLHAWVWRLFQVLALPVLITLLAWWRAPIFVRLERESEISETVQAMLRHQRGVRSFGSAANGAFWLLANGMRRSLMRTFLRVGDGQGLSFGGAAPIVNAEVEVDERPGISDEARTTLLYGELEYEKHARSDRRRLIRWGNNQQSGMVAVVGERGIGKSAFLFDVVSNLEDKAILINCSSGQYAEVEEALCAALSVEIASENTISEALQSKDIRIVAIKNLHRLSRPVMGGQSELRRFTDLIEAISHKVLWVVSVDRFTWQFIKRVRADQASIFEVVDLPVWTEGQMSALIEQRTASANLEPDFSSVQVPSEHAVTSFDSAEERNKAGIYRMIWTMAGGNPAVALLIWTNCLVYENTDDAKLCVRLPAQPDIRELDDADHNILLVLRCIAQSELISEQDVVDNLRLPSGAVGSALHYCISRGWIEPHGRRYRLTMIWFKTITRTLARQNLLAR